MKFSASAAALKETFSQAAALLPSTTAHPAYACLLLEARDGAVRVTATDGQERLTTSCVAQVDEPGDCCVHAASAAATVRSMKDVVTVAQTDRDLVLTDGAGLARLRLPDLTPNRYPPGDDTPHALCSFSVPGPALAHCLRVVAGPVSASKDGAKSGLDGVAFDLLGDDLGLIASDSSRLATSRVKVDGVHIAPPVGPDGAGPAPDRFVATMAGSCLRRALALAKSAAGLDVLFTSGRGVLKAALFTYEFPLTAYDRKLPWRGNANYFPREGVSFAVDAALLDDAVGRATACLVRHDNDRLPVNLTFKDGTLTVAAAGQAGDATAALAAQGQGEVACKVSGAFLSEHLRTFDGPVQATIPDGAKLIALTHEQSQVAVASMYDVDQPCSPGSSQPATAEAP